MSDPIQAALSLTRRSDFVHLSTLRVDGFPDTRVLFNLLKLRAQAIPDRGVTFTTWLGTNTSSQKVTQIRRDPRACLYYVDTAGFEGLSLQGTLEEVLDPAIRATIWTDDWNMYYPGGLKGGDFALLRFHPVHGRYYQGLRVVEFDAKTCGAAR